MTIAVALAATLWMGRPALLLVGAIVAVEYPVVGLLAIAALVGWTRVRGPQGVTPDHEAEVLQALAADLHGGSSPRGALRRAMSTRPSLTAVRVIRSADFGLGGSQLARELAAVLPTNGRLAGAAFAVADATGAPLAPIAHLLARRAADRGRLLREHRAATAQVRLTAWVIAGLPVLLLVGLGVSGRLEGAWLGPIAVIGMGLQVAGITIVMFLMRRSK